VRRIWEGWELRWRVGRAVRIWGLGEEPWEMRWPLWKWLAEHFRFPGCAEGGMRCCEGQKRELVRMMLGDLDRGDDLEAFARWVGGTGVGLQVFEVPEDWPQGW
jgi:hypothetical protein